MVCAVPFILDVRGMRDVFIDLTVAPDCECPDSIQMLKPVWKTKKYDLDQKLLQYWNT